MINPVNETGNYQVQVMVDNGYQTVLNEFAVSTAINIAENLLNLCNVTTRVISRETNTVIAEFERINIKVKDINLIEDYMQMRRIDRETYMRYEAQMAENQNKGNKHWSDFLTQNVFFLILISNWIFTVAMYFLFLR